MNIIGTLTELFINRIFQSINFNSQTAYNRYLMLYMNFNHINQYNDWFCSRFVALQ